MPIETAVAERNWRLAGVGVFAVATVLLLSMGGAVVAAPLTVPLMVLVSRRHPTVTFRVAGIVLTGLTVAEVVWALTYLQLHEAKPWIWLLPLVGGVMAGGSFMAATIRAAASGRIGTSDGLRRPHRDDGEAHLG